MRGFFKLLVLVGLVVFLGLVGGLRGLSTQPLDYPTTAFFSVAVMVLAYHIFSEWLSLIVKTRSSQAVTKLLDLEPYVAYVVKDGKEQRVPLEKVRGRRFVPFRPRRRNPGHGAGP